MKTARRNGERGMAMLIVLMILAVVSLLGLAALTLVVDDTRVAGAYRDNAQAFWAAEGALQNAVAYEKVNRAYAGPIAGPTLTNQTTNAATASPLSGYLILIDAVGRKGAATKKLEAIINTDNVFGSAINVGGDLTLVGKPRISSQGIRLNGNANLELDPGTQTINLFVNPASTVTNNGDPSALNQVATPPMDLPTVKLTDQQWLSLASNAAPAWYFDNDHVFGSATTNVTFNNLDFNDVAPAADGTRTIYVDGDVTINGSLSGVGTIVSSGQIICTGGFRSNSATASLIAKSNVVINFDTNAESTINGLVYAEGNYELHGKVKFTGVVTAFGSVDIQDPSQFTDNSDPNFWFTYSSAYSVIADPVSVLSWEQLQ